MGEVALYPVGATQPSATITAANLGQGQFQPTSIALDAQNDLFITDQQLDAVWDVPPPYLAPSIAAISQGLLEPIDVAVSKAGTLFVADVDIDYAGGISQAVRMYQPPYSTETDLAIPANDEFAPFCLALDAQSNLFATSAAWSAGNSGTMEYAPPYNGSPASYAFGGNWGYAPTFAGGGCTLDPGSGELFVGYGSTIEAYAPPYNGAAMVIPEGADGNATVAVSSANHDFFVANGASVDVYAPPYTTKTSSITMGVNKPNILAVDTSGNLFVGSTSNGTITEYAAPYTGAPVWTLSAFGVVGSSALAVIP